VEPAKRDVRALRSVAGEGEERRPDPDGELRPIATVSPKELATRAERALGRSASRQQLEEMTALTAGVPWLVDMVLAAMSNGDESSESTLPTLGAVVRELGVEIETRHADLQELLLALSVGFELSGRLPPTLDELEVADLVSRARAAGLLAADGQIVPLVRRAVLETTPEHQLRSLQHVLVDHLVAAGRPLDGVAKQLARDGLKDARVARALERAGDSVLATRPAAASALYGEAEVAGTDKVSTAARRAQAAYALGDLDAAARILDELLVQADPPDVGRAVDVAAAVWAHRGMLSRSAEIYGWLGTERVGPSAPLAAVAMIGSGDLGGAEAMLGAAMPTGSPTLRSVAVALMGQGLRESVEGSGTGALPTLTRASDMTTSFGGLLPLPEVPAVLAALVALHSGELVVAESIVDWALSGEQCGPVARPRLLLFRAWAAMLADREELARSAIRQASDDDRELAPRDELLLRALEVGLARRADDAPALVRAWHNARETILHVQVDLFSLLPLAELVVAATRVRDSASLEAPLAEGWALLERLGDPPLWSAPLHWAAVQAAILADRPAELQPHAAALVRASGRSQVAAVLAAAGRAWIAVRAGTFQVAAVEDAARGLASVGLAWDGARLAGHAAARSEERREMTRLLACARSLHPGAAMSAAPRSREGEPVAGTRMRPGMRRDEAGLSAREREVARLVLDGNTYGEIGAAMFISPRTVEHHIARIRHQLGASTRSDMLAKLRVVLDADPASPE
jgi:DNA-binding CsgD family transcriptional regulator